jgi:hypothetical protein
MENPELLSTGIPIPRLPISQSGRYYDTWLSSTGWLRSILGFLAPIHWSLNPQVAPDRSNGCWVFQPRSDGSYWSLPVHSSMTPWTWKRSTVQILSWTLGIYGPKLFATHEDIGNQSGKAFNTLLSPTNLTVMGDRSFPDEISSVDHHLSRLRHLTLHLLLPI